MTKKELSSWLLESANEYRSRAIDTATRSIPDAFALSCYYDGYADALLFAVRYLDRVED